MPCPNELIRAVRKDLACSLRDLLQHGLYETSYSGSGGGGGSMVPFGCFVVRSRETATPMHAWDLLVKYYDAKHGRECTQSAANKLSQSFALTVVAGKPVTVKQSLLNAVEHVIKLHKGSGDDHHQANKDSCFKAFVCLAIK